MEKGRNNMNIGYNEKNCLSNMIEIYRTALVNRNEEDKQMERMVACAMVKRFIGYLFLQNQISQEEYDYAYNFNIMEKESYHRSFIDVISRWCKR